MRIGLLADVHGNIHALNACLDRFRAAAVEKVLCAGDVIGYYPFVNEVIESLRRHDVIAIRGNHEAYLLGLIQTSEERFHRCSLDWVEEHLTPENRSFVSQLPARRAVELQGKRLLMFHGSPWSVEEYVYPDYPHFDRFAHLDADLVVLGHTHIPMVRRSGTVTIVNPGSCGQPRDYNPQAAYGLLDTETMGVELGRVEYDVDAVCRGVADEGLWSELAVMLKRTRSSGPAQVP